jgi:hypothetical protein
MTSHLRSRRKNYTVVVRHESRRVRASLSKAAGRAATNRFVGTPARGGGGWYREWSGSRVAGDVLFAAYEAAPERILALAGAFLRAVRATHETNTPILSFETVAFFDRARTALLPSGIQANGEIGATIAHALLARPRDVDVTAF